MRVLVLMGEGFVVLVSLIFLITSVGVEASHISSFVYPENYNQIGLPKVNGPESFAFDCHGKGPYASVSDGRVLKWEGQTWKEFAITSPNRPRDLCDGSTSTDNEATCGRPLGLKFHPTTCHLYIADAYFGLLVVGPAGGLARPITTSAEGVPLRFTNALDIDAHTGLVYFTDSSTHFQRRVWLLSVISGDRTGRLLQYDPRTKKTTVLLNGLAFPDGVALSSDSSFLLLAETTTMKIYRVWLRGQRAHTSELFVQLGRSPDNIKRARDGGFWIALNSGREVMRSLLPKTLPLTMPSWIVDPVAIKLDGNGNIVAAVDGHGESALESVSEVMEHAGKLWFGSAVKDYVGVMRA